MGKTCSVLACLVLAGFDTLGPLSVAAQAQGFKPQPISGTISFGPPTPGTCSFQVDIFFQGKAGQINLPGGRIPLEQCDAEYYGSIPSVISEQRRHRDRSHGSQYTS